MLLSRRAARKALSPNTNKSIFLLSSCSFHPSAPRSRENNNGPNFWARKGPDDRSGTGFEDASPFSGDNFTARHIGPRARDQTEMLATCGFGVRTLVSFVGTDTWVRIGPWP